MTTEHLTHSALPSGFAYANAQQTEEFNATGFITGASKVCLVRKDFDQVDVAVRLRPPRHIREVVRRDLIRRELGEGLDWSRSETALRWYIREYNNGWAAAGRAHSVAFERATTTHSWDDGFLDRNAGRPKWHITHCLDHDTCGEG